MNKQELIEAYERISSFCGEISVNKAIENLKQLDEPTIYVKNILARLRELPLHDREVWLKAIMGEFEQDFSHAKWREGYEQGKFEASMIPYSKPQEVTVPQCIAEHIERSKEIGRDLQDAMNLSQIHKEVDQWLYTGDNMDTFARAWLDGYEVEKEHKYNVKFKGISRELNYLNYNSEIQKWYLASNSEIGMVRTKFARKELEEAGFGWVFDCEGIEIEEVEE